MKNLLRICIIMLAPLFLGSCNTIAVLSKVGMAACGLSGIVIVLMILAVTKLRLLKK